MTTIADSTQELEAVRLDFHAFCATVGQLPEECRKAFVLRVIYEYSHEELAEYCGIPVGTIKACIEQGLELAQTLREDRGDWRLLCRRSELSRPSRSPPELN